MSRDDYIEVSDRIIEFRAKYPDGSLRVADPSTPYRIEHIGEQAFIVVVAAAYRHPEDAAPGIGCAWEPVPGRTNFTRFSELQNAETSAWGRALIAVGAADAKRGIASADEVRNRARDSQMRTDVQPDICPHPGEPRPATRPQITRLQILLGEAGIKDRQEKLDYCMALVQRPLSSSNDLLMHEAKLVMDTLTEAAKDTHQGAPDAV